MSNEPERMDRPNQEVVREPDAAPDPVTPEEEPEAPEPDVEPEEEPEPE